MGFFDEIFPLLGITISSNEGKLPLIIRGPLKPSNIEIDGSLSSQFLTGLLMAYAASGADGVLGITAQSSSYGNEGDNTNAAGIGVAGFNAAASGSSAIKSNSNPSPQQRPEGHWTVFSR